jgi:hypothetical protein
MVRSTPNEAVSTNKTPIIMLVFFAALAVLVSIINIGRDPQAANPSVAQRPLRG